MLHVERHASCKVIRLCHKNVINCIMAVGQIKRMISLTYANPFLVHALVPILINYKHCYHGITFFLLQLCTQCTIEKFLVLMMCFLYSEHY